MYLTQPFALVTQRKVGVPVVLAESLMVVLPMMVWLAHQERGFVKGMAKVKQLRCQEIEVEIRRLDNTTNENHEKT